MANLDDEIEFVAHHLAVELVRGGVSKRTIKAALKSLARKEGDRRAEDMRERAALATSEPIKVHADVELAMRGQAQVQAYRDGLRHGRNRAADAIRSLPLGPTK